MLCILVARPPPKKWYCPLQEMVLRLPTSIPGLGCLAPEINAGPEPQFPNYKWG